jgi:hypothetical protein
MAKKIGVLAIAGRIQLDMLDMLDVHPGHLTTRLDFCV